MRRPGRPAPGLALLALLPMVLAACDITCACLPPPTPNGCPTPPTLSSGDSGPDSSATELPLPVASPACSTAVGGGGPLAVSPDQAGVYAAKFAGLPAMTAGVVSGLSGRSFYQAASGQTVVFVDGQSGVVLEVVFGDKLPVDETSSATEAVARTAAEAFMARVGLSTDGLTEAVTDIDQAGVAGYLVSWTDISANATSSFEIFVNASTGAVATFVDLRMELPLAAPVVGAGRADQLALVAVSIPGESVLSTDLEIGFSAGSQTSAWQVGLGVPSATQSGAYEHGALVSVDATSGRATIAKS